MTVEEKFKPLTRDFRHSIEKRMQKDPEFAEALEKEMEEEYQRLLLEVEALMDLDPEPDTEEGQRLNELAAILEAYEKEHFPI